MRYVMEVEMDVLSQQKELKKIEKEQGKLSLAYLKASQRLDDLLEELDLAQAENDCE